MIESKTWRMSIGSRVMCAVVGALMVGIGVATAVGWMASDPGGVQGEIYSALMIAMGPVGAWLLAFRPRLSLDQQAVTVVNPLSTRVIPLDHIQPANSTRAYAGLVITYFDAGRMRRTGAWAIQKWNLSVWLNRETRADRISQEINAAAYRVQSGHASA